MLNKYIAYTTFSGELIKQIYINIKSKSHLLSEVK